MRKVLIYTCLLLAMGTLFSCSGALDSGLSGEGCPAGTATRSPKIVGEAVDCSETEVLFKLSSVPGEEFLAAMREDGFDCVEPVFPPCAGEDIALKKSIGLDRWYSARVTDGGVEKAAERLAERGDVSLVQFNALIHRPVEREAVPAGDVQMVASRAAADQPFNDPYFTQQWGLLNKGDTSFDNNAFPGGDINVVDVWRELVTGDAEIVVAVMDEGVKYSHPDLKANMWVNSAELNGTEGVDDDGNGYVDDIYGYNFASSGAVSWNKDGDVSHGTHCAGIIAAVNNNGIGVSSVAGGDGTEGSGVKLMSVQIFDGKKTANDANTAKGYKYAADNGASVISCSFGYKGGTYTSDGAYMKAHQVTVDALRYFEAKKNNSAVDGGVAIFAAGNDALNFAEYPGALNDVICVSAYAVSYLPSSYTNYGPGCNIVAPGGDDRNARAWGALICSTVASEVSGSDYGYMMGTSMACPFVSGVAALGIAYARKLGRTFTLQRFKEMLVTSALEFDSRLSDSYLKYRHMMGTGGVDTWTFLMQIEGIPSVPLVAGKTQFVDLSPFFGTASKSLTYLKLEMSDADKAALGITTAPSMQYGKLKVNPTKVGSGKIRITAVAGGDAVGGQDAVGGMEVTQEVSLVSRYSKSSNGGWL